MSLLDLLGNADNATPGGPDAGTVLGAIGAGLLSGNRYQPIGPGFTASLQANSKTAMPKAALKALLIQAGATPDQAETYSANEKVAQLALAQLKQQKLGALYSSTNADEGAFFGGGQPCPCGYATGPRRPSGRRLAQRRARQELRGHAHLQGERRQPKRSQP